MRNKVVYHAAVSLLKCTKYTFDPLHTYKVYLVYRRYEKLGCDAIGERYRDSSSAFHLESPEEKS